MKPSRFILIAAAALILAYILWGAYSNWKQYRGLLVFFTPPPADITEILNTTGMPLSLKPGFSISIFAKGLGAPRVLSYDPAGNIIVSIPAEGKVVALRDKNSDGAADETIVLLEGLNRPHGLATRCTERCQLFVAESDKVSYYDYVYDEAEQIHRPSNGRKIIDLPDGGRHFTRTILFMPSPEDHRLLVSVGSSCDVCEETDSRRAKILTANAGGSDLKEFASGLRNAVFMTIHPVTGEIWSTEMGRDNLGDDLPPDEINIVREGGWYGWPWFYGKNIEDLSWTNAVPGYAFEPIPSRIDIPAHSSPLGLAFVPEEGWPEDYWYNLLVAEHGSWNRSEPTGYKIVRYILDEKGNGLGEEDFITGWLTPDGVLGRPVDILVQPGGIMYISDDKAGVIYRVSYDGQRHE